MDYISRSHRSNNHGTLHGTVSLLLKFALTYDDLSTSDLRSAAAAYAASVPPNNQTINQQTINRPNAQMRYVLEVRHDMRHMRPPRAGNSQPAAVAFARK